MKEKFNINSPLKIAVVGKGGTGKSVITSLLARVFKSNYQFKMLLIDADPTHPHLSNMVKLEPKKSLEEIRNDLVRNVSKENSNAQTLAEDIDLNIYNSMAENKDYCLLSIGQPQGPGCFCPSNTLLRKVIESISKDFDVILIDCEAGIEQISRMVIKTVDILLIITDISVRSVNTADSIRNCAKKFSDYKKLGVVVNKVKGNIENILKILKEMDLQVFAEIPDDENVIKFDLKGDPIVDIPENSPSLLAIKKLAKKILNQNAVPNS